MSSYISDSLGIEGKPLADVRVPWACCLFTEVYIWFICVCLSLGASSSLRDRTHGVAPLAFISGAWVSLLITEVSDIEGIVRQELGEAECNLQRNVRWWKGTWTNFRLLRGRRLSPHFQDCLQPACD